MAPTHNVRYYKQNHQENPSITCLLTTRRHAKNRSYHNIYNSIESISEYISKQTIKSKYANHRNQVPPGAA